FFQQGKILNHARAAPEQCHAIAVGWLAEIQLGIHVANPCAQRRQLMQQPALVLARLNDVLLTREPVDDVDTDAGLPDTVAQLRRGEPLSVLSRQTTDAIEQRSDPHFRAPVTEQRALWRDHIVRIAFTHNHLVGAPVVASRRYAELVAHRPKAQQADPELALWARGPFGLEPALDGITDVGRHVAEIRPASVVARHAIAIVADREKMAPVLAPTRDRHSARLRINAVFDQLGDRLQWAGLRQGDDSDGVPVVADLQLAARPARVFCLSVHATARCFARFLLSWRGPARTDRSRAGPEISEPLP